jgi:hypothetical protein
MKKQVVGLGAVILVILSLSPLAHSSESESPYPIPDGVLASADEYVISKVGQAFFDSCMTWSPGWSCFRPLDPSNVGRSNIPDWCRWPRYIVIYKLRIPGKPFVDEVVVVNIREDGRWFEDVAHDEGLPDCVSHPEECEFPIDEAAAIEIAREAGLQEGRKPWRSDLRWSGRTHRTYVWEIRNELEQLRGEFVFIDANDGTVLEVSEWHVDVQGHPPTAP